MSIHALGAEARSQFRPAVDSVANHCLKALAYSALCYLGEQTVNGLSDSIVSQTGLDEVQGYVIRYPLTFAATGFARTREGIAKTGGKANYYTATEQETALPSVGTALEWADRYSMSLTATLSESVSRSDGKGPYNTIEILDALLDGANIDDLVLTGYTPNKYGGTSTHNRRIKRMLKDGLIEVEEGQLRFSINNPSYTGKKPFDALDLSTRQVYQVLQIAEDLEPDTKWTIPELIEQAIVLGLVQPDELHVFKLALTRAASAASHKAFEGAIDKIDLVPRRYRVSPDFYEAAQDLVERMKILETATDTKLKQLSDYAIESYCDPGSAQKIAERGIANSHHNASRRLQVVSNT